MTETLDETPIVERIHGLDCDNPECRYEDKSVALADYATYIDRPCPDCGEPLLTQKTYDELMDLVRMVEIMNTLSESDANDNSPHSKDKRKVNES